VLRFAGPGADVDAESISVYADRAAPDELDRWGFRLRLGDAVASVQLQLVGEHQVTNAVAAAATAYALGIDPDTITTVLSNARLRSPWRMELQQRTDGLAVINDAYNANPTSMSAALTALARIAASRRERGTGSVRSIAVLGEMLELGDAASELHAEVGRAVAEQGIDRLIIVGPGADPIGAGAQQAGLAEQAIVRVPDKDAALHELADLTGADVVLIKASRDIGLETVGDRLLADDRR
jgi:UDP-N-acetylmuramoyl-tripeptide--D-alanyl-D-alanine ligase